MAMRKRKVYFKLFLVSGSIFIICGIAAILINRYDYPAGIHVITNFPLMTEKPWNEGQTDTNRSRLWQRQEEIEETLQKNLNHTLVTAVHLLVNQPLAEQRLSEQNFHNKHKLFVHRINALPKYRDFFDYVNDRLQNKLVVMMTMDIYLGEGFEMVNKTFLVKSNKLTS
jgi:hypothetical protein